MKPNLIIINSMLLINFKGIRHLQIDFKEKENFISGDNATGKTTIMDAFMWQLFDKDSAGRKDFNIKTLGPDGEPLPDLDHEVITILTVNGEKVHLRKVYKEKWTKPRGQKDLVFSGHETIYYFNEVPLAQKDYNQRIEAICQEEIFKIITNPACFPSLNWIKQRSMLINIAGSVSDTEIAGTNPAFSDLLVAIKRFKDADEYKKYINSQKRLIKDDLEKIPARLDEVQRSLPVVLDWKEIERQISETEKKIETIETQIANDGKGIESKREKRSDLHLNIANKKNLKAKIDHDADTHIENLKYEFDKKLRNNAQSVNDLKQSIKQKEDSIVRYASRLETLRALREGKISEWHKIMDECLSFSTDSICPTCGQSLPEDFINSKRLEAENKFNDTKSKRIELNVQEGKKTASDIKETETLLENTKSDLENAKSELEKLNNTRIPEPDYASERSAYLTSIESYESLIREISSLEEQLQSLGNIKVPDNSILIAEKKNEHLKLHDLMKSLGARERISEGQQRISELKSEQQKLSQAFADLERIEFNLSKFTKARIEAIEQKVNSMFRLVRFKMFNLQVNGGEQETCECTVDGVPYSDLNNAMKINAGLDILSTLSEKYGITAPVFLDNRESVNNLLPVSSQMINLVVTKDKELVIN